ncbi:hypothetical protein HQ305_20070 [Rhodococcus sp. BP-149]|uniref:hypothetical protein n=1 Tax=unclassified Rhodococcus (in: high G+C Gram-positive bacteria) TaxID=192944 RepID=UPI0006F9FDD4|nr:MULTISPECIES: hypothetical protein [unclassified Rhodococcus (in: high G+C Gram-positive bacteria)]KQU28106.1 hypothetical protein ASG69_08605 [Rhodococcus sp. Leaf225]KQU46216.1 hypothetical protein ASH03_05640 [Rhodococcus sp. Leaf258]MBY6687532.1 hypothetical protein [Rhodococcus sp. BP-288]MBY6695697.1 hypothetical protein [Rhodococcus sp. BP-188]MBY6700505.1 hypothetical protein [Rhodococcus sp. BP-285]
MSQLSFFSAESTPPDAADLAGLLAAQGQPVIVSGRTRISVVVDATWRAHAVADLIESCGFDAEITTTDEGRPLVRTEPVPELASLAAEWVRGAVKAVPGGWVPGPRALRAWVVAAGRQEAGGARFVLGLDPHAPDTHPVLAQSLMRAGVAPTLVGTHGGSPALRITGRRRVTRLIENIGEPPPGALAAGGWPVLV